MPSQYQSIVLADAPTAYWRLGEASGSPLVDEIANAHPLTVTAGMVGHLTYSVPGALVGDSNTGLAFDGAATAGLTVVPSIVPGATVSIEFWLKPSAGGGQYTGLIGAGGGGNGVYWDATNRKIRVNTPGGDVLNTTPLALGTLYHVVIAINAGTITFYLNGVADGGGSGWTGAAQINSVAYAGGVALPAGLLDEVAIYPTALSAARVKLHYDASGRSASTKPRRTRTSMDDQYSQYRRFYEDISVGLPILATDTTKNIVTARGPLYTIFVQRISPRINGASAGKTWDVQDNNSTPISLTGPLACDIAPNDFGPIDFGAEGVPLTQGKNLRVVISAAGASGIISVSGYQKLTGIDSVAPGTAAQ
jgi:hypothetical protein